MSIPLPPACKKCPIVLPSVGHVQDTPAATLAGSVLCDVFATGSGGAGVLRDDPAAVSVFGASGNGAATGSGAGGSAAGFGGGSGVSTGAGRSPSARTDASPGASRSLVAASGPDAGGAASPGSGTRSLCPGKIV